MSRPSFANVGLRRDLNLADLENKETALNNLLNDLVTTEDGSTFDSKDLLQAIQGISNTNVTNRSIALMAGLTVKNTVIDPETNQLVDEVASPLITVKNQIDTILATTNDPPFFNGGDGLTASFYEPTQIRSEESLNINSSGSQIFSGSPVATKKFWTNGLFEFSNKLDDALSGSNGLIQWTGFYIPDASGPSTFRIDSTGYIIVEFADQFGNLQIKKNIYKRQRTVFSVTGDAEGVQFTASTQEAATIVIGDVLTAVYDENGDPVPLPENSVIRVDNVGATTISLSDPINESGIGENWRFDFDINDRLGIENFSFSFVLPELEKYVPVQMRITYWFPGDEVEYFNKTLDVNLSTSLKNSSDLPYWYLYTEVGDQNLEEGFKGFYDKRLLLGGGTIGPEEVLVASQYNKWLSISPLVLRYDPPRVYSDAVKAVYRYGVLELSNIISVTTTNPFTDNLEIGNIIIADAIPDGAFITDISRNNSLISSESSIEDGVLDIVFLDHRGYLGNTFATSSEDIVTVSSTTGLIEGTVIINENMSEGDYIRVLEILNSRQFKTNRNLNLNGSERIFYYSDNGLANRAYDNFCVGTIGAEIALTASNGDTYLTLNTVQGLVRGQVIQAAPFIPFDPLNSEGSIITRIEEVNPDGYPDNTVRITYPLNHPEGKDMVAGITVVISPSNTTLDKESCVIPLNTAPPFVGTIDGLRTTDGTGGTKDLELSNPSGSFKTLNLKADNVGNVLELPTSGPYGFDRTIEIKCAGVSYNILSTTDDN